MRSLSSEEIYEMARLLDGAHSYSFNGATEDFDPASRASVSIMIAGFIAGRADIAIDDMPEGRALFEKAREMGRDAALMAKARG